MATQVTNGIKISVATTYAGMGSELGEHFFRYKISIENRSEYTVKLLKRHWFIFDSMGEYKEVEGDGVVGEQPLLAPGDVYEYESASNLMSEIGKMEGFYIMMREYDHAQFKVQIPEFYLLAPHRLN